MAAIAKVLQQVEALIDEGDGAAAGVDDPYELSLLRGQIALLHGQQAYYRNQQAETLACCQEALALLPQSWTYGRGGAMLYWGMSMRASGQGDAAQRMLLDQYESWHEKADAYALRLLFAACHNFVEAGQLEQAKQTAQLMLEQATRSRLAVLQGRAHYFLGLASYYRNDLDAAGQHLEPIRITLLHEKRSRRKRNAEKRRSSQAFSPSARGCGESGSSNCAPVRPPSVALGSPLRA
jgi:tetratricopeptide (TPR) repeat protein